MKTKFLRIGKRTISVVLSLMMVVSVMLVGMVPTSAAISYWYVSGSFNGWIQSASDTYKLVNNQVTVDMNNSLGQEITFKMVAVEGENKWCGYSGSSAISSGSKIALAWDGGNDIKFKPTKRYVTFAISVENNTNYLTVTESDGGGSTISKWHVTGHQDDNNNISWNTNKLVINGATGSTTLTTSGNTNPIYFKLVAEKSDNTKYLCTASGTSSKTLQKGVKSDALDWKAGFDSWTNFDSANNSNNSDVELIYTPSSSAVSVTFKVSSDGDYNYVTVTETTGSVVDPDDPDDPEDEETGTATGYYLNEATSSDDPSFKKDKNFKHYTNDDANVYYLTTFLTKDQYLSVYNPYGNNFYAGGEFGVNTDRYFQCYGDTTIQHSKFTGDTGLYKIKLTVESDEKCKIYITPGGKSVAKNGVTLTIKENVSSADAGTSLELVEDRAIENGVLLTTTFTSNVAAAATKQVTYYFNYLDEDGKPLTTQPLEYKAEIGETSITHNYVVKTADDNEYTVEVSTTESYKYSTDTGYTTLGYLSAKSGKVTLNVTPTPLYIIPVKDGVLDFANSKEITTETPYKFTLTSTATTLASSTFILSSVNEEAKISEVLVKSYDPDDSRTAYSAIEKGKMQVGEEFFTTYTITPNHYCSNPVLYLDKSGAQPVIYSVAKYTKNVTNTKDNKTEKVTYYFAEPTGAQNISKSGEGLKIAYWNNTIDYIQNGDATNNIKSNATTKVDVTTKVNVKGKNPSDQDTENNTIYIKTSELYDLSTTSSDYTSFYIYSVEVPIWATSFAFMNGDDVIWTKSINGEYNPYSSIQLNPNRVYLLYKSGDNTYCKGVVLDNLLWNAKRTLAPNVTGFNEPGIKTFKSNAVNYRTEYNNDGTLSNAFNTRIKDRYYSSFPNPLYFGYFDQDTGDNANGLTGFEIENNLAMRNKTESDERYYFASVQNLVHPILSDTDKNANGYGYLRGANGVNMPLFDYDELKKDNEKYKNDATNKPLANIVAEGADFPFYESEFNGVKTYSYDSTTDKNRRYNPSTGTFDIDTTTHGYRNATLGGTKGIGYFPFGLDDYGNAYGFATEFDIDFYMSNTGYLTSSTGKEDIAFNFSGDDDVWVFIDGILVLDLGGAHKASSGTINLSDMKVYYKTAAKDTDSVSSIHDTFAISSSCVNTVDLAEIFAANGKKFNNTDASTKHTLQMFYMERGSFDSNCSISFNLPQNNGVLVQNNVDFEKVNKGLLEVTKDVANRDYFSYYIGGKYANETEYEYAKAFANNSTLPHFVHGNSAATDGYYTNLFSTIYAPDIPKYPLYSNNSVVRRVINNKTYILLREGRTDGQSSIDAGTYETAFKTASDAKIFYGFNALNYSLGDAQAKAESNTTTIDLSTAVSGRTDNGKFPLLFGQSAQFTSKIPANALVQVYQENDLYKVTIPTDTNGNALEITKGDRHSNRDVKSYYTTAYEIVDDKSQKTIGSRADAINDGNPIYADDKTDIENAFYYSNYSGISSTTAYAMTVNYTNSVAVGDIKITKKLKDGQIPNSDKFYFTVKFSNIFGDSENYSAMTEYRDLEYTVYDADGSNPSTYTYSVAGIALKAGQYAVISGVPVGTKYEIVENSKLGYTFESMKATVTAGGNTLDVDDTSIIPTVDESKSTTSTVVVDVVNSQSAFEIVLKYYDREIVDGRPAHISKTPTVFKYSLDQTQVDNECVKDGVGNVTS
ncbi:MAG: fibro-slime domain-containing protein, partial [Ruminococcus sp.]|nr:fibro-slime domain-containing protein [Ruminococcus sp.]